MVRFTGEAQYAPTRRFFAGRRGRSAAVAKKKDSKALFEVLSGTNSSMSVPAWMKPRAVAPLEKAAEQAAPEHEESPPASTEEPEDSALVPPTPPPKTSRDEKVVLPAADDGEKTSKYEQPRPSPVIPSPEPPVAAPTVEPEADVAEEGLEEEIFREEENEEEIPASSAVSPAGEPASPAPAGEAAAALFSFRPRTVVILIVVVAVLILAAILLGRWTARRSGATSDAPRDYPSLPALDVPDAPAVCTSGQRDADRFFLIYLTLRGNGDADKAEADRIVRFCAERGLPADMVELQVGEQPRVAVWGLLGFRFHNSKAALDHARTVEEVGEAYYRKYKTYRFPQRRRKDGTLHPFFVSGQAERAAKG